MKLNDPQREEHRAVLRHVLRLTIQGTLPLVIRNGKHPHYRTRRFGAAIFEASKDDAEIQNADT